jgi:hypothetical protein
MRHAGIPLPEPLINNDLLIGIVVTLGVAMLVLLKQPRSLVLSSLAGVITTDGFFAKNATIGEYAKHYILLVLSVLGLSLYATKLFTPLQFEWKQIGLTFIGICSFLVVKLLLMNVYFRLFFGKKSRELLYQYISLIIIIGIVAYFGYTLLQYAPLIPPIIIHTIIGIICVCCALLVIYILFKDFFNRPYLFFHFILYLCTLEILPILAIAKSLA